MIVFRCKSASKLRPWASEKVNWNVGCFTYSCFFLLKMSLSREVRRGKKASSENLTPKQKPGVGGSKRGCPLTLSWNWEFLVRPKMVVYWSENCHQHPAHVNHGTRPEALVPLLQGAGQGFSQLAPCDLLWPMTCEQK